jgi:hypothetical protein
MILVLCNEPLTLKMANFNFGFAGTTIYVRISQTK